LVFDTLRHSRGDEGYEEAAKRGRQRFKAGEAGYSVFATADVTKAVQDATNDHGYACGSCAKNAAE